MNIIPVSEPLIGKREEELVLDCLRSGWISSEGKYVKEFEKKCASYCSMNAGISVSAGTAALQVAVSCLPIDKGDEIIMPAFTIISCATAIIESGAKPVLVDCDPDTWTMNTEEIEQKITNKTKAIMAVHIYGHSVDMQPVNELAKKHNLFVIEDAAEAHGAEYKGTKCGGLSDISILSFYANKLVTTGEGGMVLTNNKEFEERARSLRNLCFKKEKRFFHTEIGHNYRMSNIQAAIGLAQLEKLDLFVDRKREMAKSYNNQLSKLPLQLPIEKEWAKNIYWMYGIVLNKQAGIVRSDFMKELEKKGIESRPFFVGMHEQPVLRDMGLFSGENYPVCEYISKQGLYLPSGHAITNSQIQYITDSINEIFSTFS
ncbi:MAG: DegT/DnrJ/EryC1/StrS family aminotransferase [Pseudomonadota bacterium]|nr:DegT/DnrJ/EryC1/StrS family aminotransferase [Pseudomonadota bacterium]